MNMRLGGRSRGAPLTSLASLWAPGRWGPRVVLLAFYAFLGIYYFTTDGLEDLRTDLPDLAFDIVVHVTLARLLTPVVLLLAVGLPALWRSRRRMRAVGGVRLAPSPALTAAATGIVPAGRLFLLADDHPFAACIGLWRPAIYVSDGLIRQTSPTALRAAIAHEEAHRRRKDPARLIALRVLFEAITPAPWLALLINRAALRAEIRADRFARHQVSVPALAEALLAALRGEPSLADGYPSARIAWIAGLGGAAGRASLMEEDSATRLRYVSLPDDAPLPTLFPPGLTLAAALRPLAHTVPYGITGRRGTPYLLAIACILICLDTLTPWPGLLLNLPL